MFAFQFIVTVVVLSVTEVGIAGLIILYRDSPTTMPVLSAFIDNVCWALTINGQGGLIGRNKIGRARPYSKPAYVLLKR